MLLKADFESNMGFLDPTIEAIMAAGEGQSLDRSQGRISDAIQVFLRSGSWTNMVVRDLVDSIFFKFKSDWQRKHSGLECNPHPDSRRLRGSKMKQGRGRKEGRRGHN